MSTDTWLKVICSMQINAILFGVGAVVVLATPALAADAKVWIPAVVVISFAIAPIIAGRIAPRMRLRHWREIGQGGDMISG
ncbi:hypothetical protein GC173_08965 [bacterium]|nr:hypothetical protein [bacterium]